MILTIAAIPDAEKLAEVNAAVGKLEWRDGKETAGKTASAVKENEQAVMQDEAGKAAQALIMPFLNDNAVLQAAAQPRRFSHLLISKTQGGGHYGSHIDNALMGTGAGRMRTDLSFTLFLTPPDDYEGGELMINSAGMDYTVKGKLGELVLYPSTSIHEVRPVTKGARIVSVGWIESLVADPTQREMLFDLENLRASLRAALPAQSRELLTVDKTIANLKRMWAVV